ncbi:MAG: hypothetical protein DCC67_17895 [Planctomycetota bacterium]|nr:MAG: hypothetical protein DCC67_17895 [Planctomycetota bacterium]
MHNPLNIAIVGCGRIAQRHAAACLQTEGARLAAAVDADLERARSLARLAGGDVQAATSIDELPGGIDGAVIATPNHLHCETAIACLKRGISVLIEKPLATTVADGEAIHLEAVKQGRVACVGYSQRHRPNVQLMKRLLEREHFGAVKRFAYQCGSRGGWSPLSRYNLDRQSVGGGVLVVMGTHFLDRMLHWFGYPREAALVHDGAGGPEANAFASFRFDFGGRQLEGEARFSKMTAMTPVIAMDAEAGTVVLADHDRAQIRLFPHTEPGLAVVLQDRGASGDPGDIFQLQLADFVAACRGEREPMSPSASALESLRLLETLYAQAEPFDAPRSPVQPVQELISL